MRSWMVGLAMAWVGCGGGDARAPAAPVAPAQSEADASPAVEPVPTAVDAPAPVAREAEEAEVANDDEGSVDEVEPLLTGVPECDAYLGAMLDCLDHPQFPAAALGETRRVLA